MATGLESQLIAGAYRANVKDPRGEIARAQEYTSKQITGAVTGIAKSVHAKKEEEKLEEEKLQKEQDDLIKGHTDDFNAIKKQRIDNGGLGM